jgi:hypothetical protein
MTFFRTHPVAFTIAIVMAFIIFFTSLAHLNNWETPGLSKMKLNLVR